MDAGSREAGSRKMRGEECSCMQQVVCSSSSQCLSRGANNGATREGGVTIYPCNVALWMQEERELLIERGQCRSSR